MIRIRKAEKIVKTGDEGAEFLLSHTLQKWLNFINLAAIVLLLLGATLFSSREMRYYFTHTMVSSVGLPLFNETVQEHPYYLADLSHNLDRDALSIALGRLINENPCFLNELTGKMDSFTVATPINTLIKSQPEFVSDVIGELDSHSMRKVMSLVAEKHPDIMEVLMQEFSQLKTKSEEI